MHVLSGFHAGTPTKQQVKINYFGGYYHMRGLDGLRMTYRPITLAPDGSAIGRLHAKFIWGAR